MTEGLELPFQWDDGSFISPFVATSRESINILSNWLKDYYLLIHQTNFLRLTDLGCGDGSALLSLSDSLFSQRFHISQDNSSNNNNNILSLKVVGLDLDETLIEKARENMNSFIIPTPHQLNCIFETVDVRFCEVEEYFPMNEAKFHILFVYLLPEALQIMQEKLLEVFQRVYYIISNRWEIPFLSKWKVDQVGMMHIYNYKV